MPPLASYIREPMRFAITFVRVNFANYRERISRMVLLNVML